MPKARDRGALRATSASIQATCCQTSHGIARGRTRKRVLCQCWSRVTRHNQASKGCLGLLQMTPCRTSRIDKLRRPRKRPYTRP